MKTLILPKQTQITLGYTHKLILTYLDLITEVSTVAFEIFPKLTTATPTFPIGTCVRKCALQVMTLGVAAAMTDLSVTIGDGGSANRFLAASEIGGTTSPVAVGIWYHHPLTTCPFVYNAADTIDLVATATGAALSALTAGKWEIYFDLVDLNQLERPVMLE